MTWPLDQPRHGVRSQRIGAYQEKEQSRRTVLSLANASVWSSVTYGEPSYLILLRMDC